MDAHFDRDGITWDEYPFAGSTVFPRGRIAWSAVRDVEPDTAPPEVRTRASETLFVPAPHSEELRVQAEAAGIATVRTPDPWGLLLEPFLDLSFDPDEVARRNERLLAIGVSARRRVRLRERFGQLMASYNMDSGLWDWSHLGLFDFLGAVNGMLVPDRSLLPPITRRVRLYWWAMALSEHARTVAPPLPEVRAIEPHGDLRSG